MRFTLRTLPALLVASLSACGPAHGTPDGGGGSACAPAKTPPNLVANPGFDCAGQDAKWSSAYGDFAIVSGGRTGNAGQLTVTGTLDARLGTADTVATATHATNFCVSAWMRGTAPFANLWLMVDGQVQQMSTPISADWIRVPPTTNLSAPAQAGSKATLVFVTSRAKAGDTLVVDDVDLWESSDPRCPEDRNR